MTRYAKPTSVEDALALLSQGEWRMLAGGTDFYPAQGNRPISGNVLDLNGLAELRGISETETHIAVGARTTWTDIARARLPVAFDGLRAAAREVGSVQVQNVGTIAGNLCNASPAADGVPPLLTLDADVELGSLRGTRYLPLQAFVLGNRRTARAPDELVTAIRIPRAATRGTSAFIKLGARRYLVISIAMAAARLETDNGRIVAVAVAVGSCSEVAQRLVSLEHALLGVDESAIAEVIAANPFAELAPIDDVRGSAAYRVEAAREVVLRALRAAMPARAAA